MTEEILVIWKLYLSDPLFAQIFHSCSNEWFFNLLKANEEVCQVTTRERDGRSESYQSMCKQKLACENNSAQNKDQCRPGGKGPSVCRTCSGAPEKKEDSNPYATK